MRIRFEVSIASAFWSFGAGEVVDESDERFADLLPLTNGPVATLITDAPPVETATAPSAKRK